MSRSPSRSLDPLGGLMELPGVAEAAAYAREEVDRLLAHRVLRRASVAVTTESAVRGAWASAALEGAQVPLEEVRSAVSRGIPPVDPVVHGALRVSAALGTLADTWRRAPRQALARLHVLAAAQLTGAAQLGRPRYADASAADRMESLVRLVSGGTQVPAVVLAAVVHGELLDLAPFEAANGVVARATVRLTLIASGVDPKAVSVPETGHLELAAAYRANLERYASGTPSGVAGWMIHCGEAVRLGAREGLAICQAVARG